MSRYVNRRTMAIVALLLLFTGGAYAYWTHGGTGTGTADTGTATDPIDVIQTSSATDLYPGGPPAVLSGNFNNDNDHDMHVNAVSATITSVTGPHIDAPGGFPCTAADYDLQGFPISVNASIVPGLGKGAWGGATSTIQLIERGANQDGCKDATVHLTYSSN
jgi:hypothetical protein